MLVRLQNKVCGVYVDLTNIAHKKCFPSNCILEPGINLASINHMNQYNHEINVGRNQKVFVLQLHAAFIAGLSRRGPSSISGQSTRDL